MALVEVVTIRQRGWTEEKVDQWPKLFPVLLEPPAEKQLDHPAELRG